MGRILFLIITSFITISILAACNSEEENKQDVENEQTEESESVADNPTEETDENENTKVEVDKNESTESSGVFEISEDDQTDLNIGDTATVQTSIGTYELTVDAAEIVGSELDGVSTELEQLIVLDLTFKNIDDAPLIAEDLMSSLGITDYIEGSNSHNSAEAYPSIDVFEGELAPGEERKTQFIADVYEGEEYYFRQNPGVVAAGTSNDVMWTITAEEAGK